MVILRISGLRLNRKVPESEVNRALKFAVVFYQLVSLKVTVEVTNKFDYISIISSGSG